MTTQGGLVALILDGGEAQGPALVAALLVAGYRVAIGGDSGPGDPGALLLPHDLGRSDQWPLALNHIEDRLGQLDVVVVGSAAIADGSIEQLDPARARAARVATIDRTMLAMRAVLPRLRHRAGSAIVVVASIAGEIGFPAFAMTSAVVTAQRAMVRSAAVHTREKGYATRVNVVLAGPLPSHPMADAMPRAIVAADAVASAVAFLLSDAARGINGAELTVDGGGGLYPA